MSLNVEVERGAAVVPKAPTESPQDDKPWMVDGSGLWFCANVAA